MNDARTADATVVRSTISSPAPADRIRQVLAMSEQLRALSLVGLRTRYPGHSTLQLVELLAGETLIPARPLGDMVSVHVNAGHHQYDESPDGNRLRGTVRTG